MKQLLAKKVLICYCTLGEKNDIQLIFDDSYNPYEQDGYILNFC